MGADFGDDVSTADAARERARFFVRNLVEPRVHHVVQRALWEEGNPFVWTIGDIEPLPRFDAGRVTASPTLTG